MQGVQQPFGKGGVGRTRIYKPALLFSGLLRHSPSQQASDPTAPSCTVTPPWECKVTPEGFAAKGPSQAESSAPAGTTQTGEEVPAHQYSSTGTAGDHISNIFSLIVRFFCIFTLPNTSPWVCTAESLLEPSKCWGASVTTALLGSAIPPQPLETAQH